MTSLSKSRAKSLRVALIQEQTFSTRAQSYIALEKQLRKAHQQGAELVLMQELHGGPYFPQIEDPVHCDLAEPIPGPSTDFFSQLAKELQIVIVISLFEERMTGLYHNTAVVIERTGEIAGLYRKMHIPDDPGFYEKFYFAPGDLGFVPIDTSVGRLGVLICWDQWFPEAARLMALAGAELLLYPTAIAWSANESPEEQARQLDAWVTVQRGHAIANNLPLLATNRVGVEQDLHFWGNSFIAGPQGEILAQANQEHPEILIADIDRDRSKQVRRMWPFFRDRRIDAYKGLTCLNITA